MFGRFLTIKSNGKVKVQGIAHPPATILAQTDNYIVIKVPGHSYYAGRMCDRGYAPMEILVYKINGKDGDTLDCEPVISWENKRKAKNG